jgi:carbon monoxide dehydrogenase subunit G
MRLEHSFEVPVPVGQAWLVLLDIERIAPCLPGATLTSFDGSDFAGVVKVKLGPVSLAYRGTGRFVERDEAAHQLVLAASGQDARGAGGASARVTAALRSMDSAPDITQVTVVADLDIAGRAAQFGRGMIADVSAKLIAQFADCLARTLAAGTAAAPEAPPPAAAPVQVAGAAPPPTVAPDAGATSVEPASGVTEPTPAGPAQAPPASTRPAPATSASTPPVQATSASAPPAHTVAPPEAAPIDLFEVSGVKGVVRRYAPYLVLAALLIVLLVALIVM